MKKVKSYLSTSSFSDKTKSITNHYAILLLIVTLLSLLGYGTYSVIAGLHKVEASAPKYEKLSSKYRRVFNQATRQYYDKTNSFEQADCKPEKVKIKYYQGSKRSENQSGHGAFAYAYLWGAYKTNANPANPPAVMKNPPTKTPRNQYCTIYWNKDEPQNIAGQCWTFMHEYGHLIGRDHTSDTNSVMYTGYAKDKITGYSEYSQPSREGNIDNVAAKNVCPSEAELQAAAQPKKEQKPKKQSKPKKKKLTAKQIKNLCEEVVNNNYNKERGWRSRACRDGAKIGIKDWNASKKTPGACYKKGRDKKVENVCNFGRTKAIDWMNNEHGYRPVP